jgi:hypothetical protein
MQLEYRMERPLPAPVAQPAQRAHPRNRRFRTATTALPRKPDGCTNWGKARCHASEKYGHTQRRCGTRPQSAGVDEAPASVLKATKPEKDSAQQG